MSELFKTRTKPEKVYILRKSVALLSLHMLHYMMLREALPWGQVQVYNGERETSSSFLSYLHHLHQQCGTVSHIVGCVHRQCGTCHLDLCWFLL